MPHSEQDHPGFLCVLLVSSAKVLPALTLLVAASASAQTSNARERLDNWIQAGLKNSPEIVAAQKRYEAFRQRPTQESTLPDPMVSLGWNSSGNPLPGAGIGSEPTANAGLMVSQEIPFPGKLKLRGAMAGKEAEAEFQQYQAVRLSLVARLKQAFYRLHYTYAAGDVLTHNRNLLDKLLRVTEARYSVGKAAQQDVIKAQTQLSILETRLVRLEQERRSREAELNSLANRPPGAPVGRPEDVTVKPMPATLEELMAAVGDDSPVLRRDQKMIERTELAVNLARKDYYPDFALNAGYYYMGSMPPMYMFRADVKLPIYFWRKQRAGVAEQVAGLGAERRVYQATGQSLAFRVKDDYLLAAASQKLMDIYSKTVVPQASLALESSLGTYEAGTVDFLSVLSNFSMVLDYEMNYYDEQLNYLLALSRLEEMTGRRAHGLSHESVASVLLVLLLVAAAFLGGYVYRTVSSLSGAAEGGAKGPLLGGPHAPGLQVRQARHRPDCGMKLEPVYADGGSAVPAGSRKVLYYRDPQQPDYKSDKPGLNPETGADLVPVYADDPSAMPTGTVRISADKQQLIGVRYGNVEFAGGSRTIRAAGKVAFDERHVDHVHTKVEGLD